VRTEVWEASHAVESDNGEVKERKAEVMQLAESQWPEWEREGIARDEESILDAAAVGLEEEPQLSSCSVTR
jgi:hypothetical protein